MARRKLVAGVALLAGSVAGALLLRQRNAGRREEIDLYYADGTLTVLDPAAPETGELLELARSLLSDARSERS